MTITIRHKEGMYQTFSGASVPSSAGIETFKKNGWTVVRREK